MVPRYNCGSKSGSGGEWGVRSNYGLLHRPKLKCAVLAMLAFDILGDPIVSDIKFCSGPLRGLNSTS
jgi:hypothetical protein